MNWLLHWGFIVEVSLMDLWFKGDSSYSPLYLLTSSCVKLVPDWKDMLIFHQAGLVDPVQAGGFMNHSGCFSFFSVNVSRKPCSGPSSPSHELSEPSSQLIADLMWVMASCRLPSAPKISRPLLSWISSGSRPPFSFSAGVQDMHGLWCPCVPLFQL